MSSRKLSRAERRRQLRDERRELDPDQIALIAHTVGRLEGFIDGYIIGKVGIESYQGEAVQEMLSLLPDIHCQDTECRPCRLAMEAVGYSMEAENEEEAYRIGRETMLDPKPPAQIFEQQQSAEPRRLRMTP